MPFRAFDAATAALMGDVFDDAWSELEKSGKLAGRDSLAARDLLASIIISLVEQGIHDPHALGTAAVAKFKR